MMGSGILGAKTILVATGLSLDAGARSWVGAACRWRAGRRRARPRRRRCGPRRRRRGGGGAGDRPVTRRVGRAPAAIRDGHAEAHPALAGVVDLDAQVPPEEIGLGALAGEGQEVGGHGSLLIPKPRARLNRSAAVPAATMIDS